MSWHWEGNVKVVVIHPPEEDQFMSDHTGPGEVEQVTFSACSTLPVGSVTYEPARDENQGWSVFRV